MESNVPFVSYTCKFRKKIVKHMNVSATSSNRRGETLVKPIENKYGGKQKNDIHGRYYE